jgi:hypothetical protein
MILSAELLEKFLICTNCSMPIGFPHKPLCLTKHLTKPNIWKKTKYDDKFITFEMKLSFNDIIAPGCRKNILTQIASSCYKQSNAYFHEKPFLPSITKSWPSAWNRDRKEKEKAKKPMMTRKIYSAPSQVISPIGNRSIWTPTVNDEQLFKPCQNLAMKKYGYEEFN